MNKVRLLEECDKDSGSVSQKGRILSYDVMRVFAAFAVIMLHVSALNTYVVEYNSYEFRVFMFYESLVNWAVPVFVMMSGALNLQKDSDYRVTLRKVLRIFLVFCFWSLIYTVYTLFFYEGGVKEGVFRAFGLQFLQGHYHMWYLIMLVGLYLALPVFRAISKEVKTIKIFLALSIVFTFFLPTINDMTVLPALGEVVGKGIFEVFLISSRAVYADFNFHLTLGFSSYFLLGYFLSSFHRKKMEGLSAILFFLMGTGMTFFFIICSGDGTSAGEFLHADSLNILIQSVCIFCFFSNIDRHSRIWAKIGRLSRYTMGIYLIHPLIIEILKISYNISSMSFEPLVSVPILSVGIFIISLACSYMIYQIPILKEMIQL